MTPIFYIKNGNLSFADTNVLSEIELYISAGDRICLVGKNGSGKSSLMKIIATEYELDSGELFQNPSINVGHLKQDMKSLPDCSIYDFILSDIKDVNNYKYNADIILEELNIDGNMKFQHCSGGQIRRACLAKSLVNKPEILLLDEPTNHLDIELIEWLEEYIKNYKGAVVCISHDRRFQENTSNKVWWIDRGILRKSNQGFKHYDKWREDVIALEESILRKMNRKLESEKSWLDGGVTARRKRNQKRLANLYRLRETLKEHQTHLKQAKEKLQAELSDEVKKTKFIIEAENISYNFSQKKLFDNFSFRVKKGEKIGVIGSNGVGKSTLIRLLTKQLEPLKGKVKHGTNIEITYFDQHRSDLNPDHNLKQTLCPSGGDQIFLHGKTMHVAPYLKKFMFDPKRLNDKVSTLSGGEASRLLLAKMLINAGNLLILDEPTNDLDIDSLEMLLEILADYAGTLIVVSHDRDFLERLVTRTLVFADNKVIDLYGGYEDYLKYHKKKDFKTKKVTKTNSIISNTLNQKKPNKLSYKHARLLEVLPKEIDFIEKRIAEIEILLSDSTLYNTNNKKFNSLSTELQTLKETYEIKLEQWLEIEELQEKTINLVNNTKCTTR